MDQMSQLPVIILACLLLLPSRRRLARAARHGADWLDWLADLLDMKKRLNVVRC